MKTTGLILRCACYHHAFLTFDYFLPELDRDEEGVARYSVGVSYYWRSPWERLKAAWHTWREPRYIASEEILLRSADLVALRDWIDVVLPVKATTTSTGGPVFYTYAETAGFP